MLAFGSILPTKAGFRLDYMGTQAKETDCPWALSAMGWVILSSRMAVSHWILNISVRHPYFQTFYVSVFYTSLLRSYSLGSIAQNLDLHASNLRSLDQSRDPLCHKYAIWLLAFSYRQAIKVIGNKHSVQWGVRILLAFCETSVKSKPLQMQSKMDFDSKIFHYAWHWYLW